MRHRGVHVGDFFLGEKEGGREFTADDEEVLVLFASQAANAIANARAHRDERRARADLEALVETSPVGVVVFDAGTGRPASLNREARRLVDGLNAPGRPPEELLGALTCRFSDGREIALAELPMKQVISAAATVRAAEVVLSVPDGRRVTLLVNATPIHAAESTVVTLQDLASLRELERLQTEFLSMVSHELRAPLTSIKGSTATVLRASRVLDPAEVRQFFRIIDAQADHMDGLIGDLLDAGRIDSGTLSVVDPRAGGGRGPGRPGPDHVRERRGPAGRPHRPPAGPAPGDGRRTAHRQGAEQPLLERVPALARDVPHSGRRGARRRPRRHLGVGRAPGRAPGVPPEQLPHLFPEVTPTSSSATGRAASTGSARGAFEPSRRRPPWPKTARPSRQGRLCRRRSVLDLPRALQELVDPVLPPARNNPVNTIDKKSTSSLLRTTAMKSTSSCRAIVTETATEIHGF